MGGVERPSVVEDGCVSITGPASHVDSQSSVARLLS